MTEESRVSRTPRTWTEGDAEPGEDVQLLRYQRDLPHPYLRRSDTSDEGGVGGWALETDPNPATWSKSYARTWGKRTAQCELWGPLVEVLPDAPQPAKAAEPNGEDAGDGEGWNSAVDWLLNSRFVDSDVLTHFWHICDGFIDCTWCYEELKGTNQEIPKPKGYDL